MAGTRSREENIQVESEHLALSDPKDDPNGVFSPRVPIPWASHWSKIEPCKHQLALVITAMVYAHQISCNFIIDKDTSAEAIEAH